AGGTGDVAFRVLAAGGPRSRGTVLYINESVLRVGAERARARKVDEAGDRLAFVTGNGETLPLHDATFDSYTTAFGVRIGPRIETALAEPRRVLEQGGRCL
ncbi:class I SAM-dependent methyltransferase, partial [Methylobacterium sp. J-088]|uniref:class I SAM-dependent methyltransferase n=1 Tax=Methylobacterium sp. J-088 TaxID=2836664 RepID=UPI001FBAF18B